MCQRGFEVCVMLLVVVSPNQNLFIHWFSTSSVTFHWAIVWFTLSNIYSFCIFSTTHRRAICDIFILAFLTCQVFSCCLFFLLSSVLLMGRHWFPDVLCCCCYCCCTATALTVLPSGVFFCLNLPDIACFPASAKNLDSVFYLVLVSLFFVTDVFIETSLGTDSCTS